MYKKHGIIYCSLGSDSYQDRQMKKVEAAPNTELWVKQNLSFP